MKEGRVPSNTGACVGAGSDVISTIVAGSRTVSGIGTLALLTVSLSLDCSYLTYATTALTFATGNDSIPRAKVSASCLLDKAESDINE